MWGFYSGYELGRLRLFSFCCYGLALAASALVGFGAYDSYPTFQSQSTSTSKRLRLLRNDGQHVGTETMKRSLADQRWNFVCWLWGFRCIALCCCLLLDGFGALWQTRSRPMWRPIANTGSGSDAGPGSVCRCKPCATRGPTARTAATSGDASAVSQVARPAPSTQLDHLSLWSCSDRDKNPLYYKNPLLESVHSFFILKYTLLLVCPLHCNFLRYHFQPFSLNLVLPSVVKRSDSEARHKAPNLT